MSDICHSPDGVVFPSHIRVVWPNISWSRPGHDSIKINVDDSFSSSFMVSGIRGVFRDHQGTFLLHFAKKVDVESAIHA